MSLVFAVLSGAVRHGGAVYHIEKDAVWESSDPFVVARPDLFSDRPSMVHGTAGKRPASQTASVVPGGRRRNG
jgi:hypothetical protein